MRALKNTMLAAMIAVGAIGCGVTPDEQVTYDNIVYENPTAPSVDEERNDEDSVDIIVTNCESWGMTYDAVNRVCVDSETDTNILTPGDLDDEYTEEGDVDRPTTTCADYGLIEENGTCVEPPLTPATLAE
jgi:hypothetical protein